MLTTVWHWLSVAPRRAALVLGCLAIGLALPGLGRVEGLGHPDEQFYLSIAADMADRGSIAPTHDGIDVFQKPPLVFWAARICTLVLGRSAAAARLPGALAAGLLVFGAVLLTAELIEGSAEGLGTAAHGKHHAAPAVAGALLLGSLGVVRFGRELMLDLPLVAALTLALWGFAAAARGKASAALWAGLASGVCLGIKGPIGVAVLAGAALYPLWRERRLAVLRSRGFLWGLALGLAVSLPWYAWAIATHGRAFYAFHITEQYFSRFDSSHGQSRFNLLWGTLLYAAPFWPLAAVGLVQALAGSRGAVRAAERFSRRHWPLAWLVTFYGIFLIPKEHGLHYPVLVLVPLVVFAAVAQVPRAILVAIAVSLAVVAVAFCALAAFPEVPLGWVVACASVGLLAAALWAAPAPAGPALGSVALAASLNLAIGTISPILGRPLLAPAAAALGRAQAVATFEEHTGPYRFDADWSTNTHEIWGDDLLTAYLDRGELILLPDHLRGEIAPPLLARLQPVVTWRRTRPYLTFTDVVTALRARNLDSLGERWALYHAAP